MKRAVQGFTLLEVLVVLSLLGILLTLIAGAISGANRAMAKAERYSTRLDEVRSTQNFLRGALGQS
ncbi:prepilin-type N-terminal cleavage/methylation domain-containing protein, partial [Pseudomonas helleri]